MRLVTSKGGKIKKKLKYFLDGNRGLVVMGGDSCSEGCGFESQHQILEHQILDGHFSHLFVIKIVMIVVNDKNK